MQILPSPTPQSFKITNEYVWFQDLYNLPATISYDVTCGSDKDEFLPLFSFTRAEWASPECDALSWYLSPHRDDFTFRTKLFRNSPTVQRLSSPWRPTVSTKFRVECRITETSATYSINGIDYATATYKAGEVPNRGYFGFAKYGEENIAVENINIRSNSMTQANTDPSVELEKTILEFYGLLQPPSASDPTGASDKQNLWYSWHFLQVYSTWGLRLPHTEATLKMKLGIADPGQYLFFGGMVEAYDEIHWASSNFITRIFPKVIDVGTSLLDFSSDASSEDGELFNVLKELIDDDPDGALELIGDLQDTTQKNTEEAKGVIILLNDYKADLVSAQAKVSKAKKLIDQDSSVSQDTIDNLSGGKDVTGSLESLRQLLADKEEEYDHNVVVATTTVTYAFVVPPVGMIAAASVAGVYGDKAVKAIKRVRELEDEIAKNNTKLNTAIQTNKVQNSANQSLSKAQRYTDLAITHATTVQNAWTSITANLSYVAEKVSQMTKEKDAEVVLKNKALVKNYAKNAGEKWTELVPPLKELTRDPYIVIEAGEKSLGELAAAVEKEVAKGAA